MRYRLVASPIDVAETLRENLFGKTDTVILTSATLSAAGTFTYIKNRLGLDAPTELLLDSPFDFENQALLYIASGLDDQQASGYQERFDAELKCSTVRNAGKNARALHQLRPVAEKRGDAAAGKCRNSVSSARERCRRTG